MKEKNSGFFSDVYEIVKGLPHGRVATYGDVARLAGRPRMAKFVGFALHSNSDPENVPCYKIVDRFGNLTCSFAFGGCESQKKLLEKEGIEVLDNKVDLEKYRIKI